MSSRTEYQYVVMQYSTDELILVDMDMHTGEYREEYRVVIPDRDVCFAVAPREDDMPAYILKHGKRDFILEYIDAQNKKIDQMVLMFGEDSTFKPLQFESAKDNGWTLEQINKVLTTNNYIDTLIREKDAIVVENQNKEESDG